MSARYQVSSVEGNRQRLDGGAMYGNVPRAVWAEWTPPDERGRIELATRAFLVEDRTRGVRILLEAGIGAFFAPKLQDRFGVCEPDHRLLASLAALGVGAGEIDLVVLSHLHFDHAGGLLTPWRADGRYELVFGRAHYLVSRAGWERARRPHPRDRASFIAELGSLLEASGRLELADGERSELLGPDFELHRSDGHSPGMLLAELATERGSLLFLGDLAPGRPWLHLPVTMGYDRNPELLVDEKASLFARCLARGTRLLFTHDAACASARLGQDDRGRFVPAHEIAVLRGLEL
jgi:glyoxylase-like metal-dependent hydrolase (beta-lactamase superfamily II)